MGVPGLKPSGCDAQPEHEGRWLHGEPQDEAAVSEAPAERSS